MREQEFFKEVQRNSEIDQKILWLILAAKQKFHANELLDVQGEVYR